MPAINVKAKEPKNLISGISRISKVSKVSRISRDSKISRIFRIVSIANSGTLPNGDHVNDSARLTASQWVKFLRKCDLLSRDVIENNTSNATNSYRDVSTDVSAADKAALRSC